MPRAAISDPVAFWHDEHRDFGRLLDLLGRQVGVFRSGLRPDYELMLDIVSYLRQYADRFHHPREDVAFARLAKYCPDLEPVLASLAQEHRIIALAGEKLVELLNAVLDEAIVERSEVEMAAATYLVYSRAHMACEDERVLPLAAQKLTPGDWQAVKDAVPAGRDPLFGAEPDARYRDLRRQISLEA